MDRCSCGGHVTGLRRGDTDGKRRSLGGGPGCDWQMVALRASWESCWSLNPEVDVSRAQSSLALAYSLCVCFNLTWDRVSESAQQSIEYCISKIFLNFIILWLCWVLVAVWGLSLFAVSMGFSLQWRLLLQSTGYRTWGLRWFWSMGLVVRRHVGSSQTRDQTYVFCIGRWILNHWTTREVL